MLEQPVGDLARGPPADRVDAGDRQEILDKRLGAGVVRAFEGRQDPGLRQHAPAASVEDGGKTAALRDAAPQAPAPDVRQRKRLEQAVKQSCVAETGGERRPGLRRCFHREGENFGVRRFCILSAEALEAGLSTLATLDLGAKDGAQIRILGRPARLVRRQIRPADGDRVFRPQAQLLAGSAVGEEQPAADLLSRHIEENRSRMQDGGLHTDEAGGKEMLQSPFSDASGGLGCGAEGNGTHRLSSRWRGLL